MKKGIRLGILLVLVLSLCGCANTEPAPELIAPMTNKVEYTKVQYSEIGRTKKSTDRYCVVASVCPKEYCQFFKKSTILSDIHVSIGDYVSEGDLIASVNCEEASKNIDNLEKELEFRANLRLLEDEQYEHDYAAAKATQSLNEVDYRALMEADPYELSLKEREKMLGGLKELEAKHELDEKLDAFDRNYIAEQISIEKERLGETGLNASHSGYVTYIKDLNNGYGCEAKENVAVISDFDDTVIELIDVDCSIGVFKKYSDYYCVINGKKYDIEQDTYSTTELQVMQSKKHYANERIQIVGYDGPLEVGDSFEVVFRNHFIPNTLSVYNESVLQDKDGYFVYVKSANGDERRDIVIGEKDEKRTQIIEGLKEGEEVRREINPLIKDSTKYKAGYKEVPLGEWKMSDMSDITYFSKYEGIVDEIFFDSDDKVEKDDLVFTLKVEGALTKSFGLKKEIENAELSRIEELSAMDETIENLKKLEYKSSIVPWGNMYEELKEGRMNGENVDELEDAEFHYLTSKDVYDAQIESCEIEKRIIDYKYSYQKDILAGEYSHAVKDLGTDGKIEFRVKESGKLGKLKIKPGNTVFEGSPVFVNKADSNPKLIVFSADILPLGTDVTVINGEEKYYGKVMGTLSNSYSRYYTTKDGDKVYLNFNKPGKGKNAYYIRMEEGFFDNLGDTREMTCIANVFIVEGNGNV